MMTPDNNGLLSGALRETRQAIKRRQGVRMENAWGLAALWVGLALVATLLGIWFRISTALTEIVVGTVAQFIIVAFLGFSGLGGKTPWITFLAGVGAIVLTFLAGAELDPAILRTKWKEATVVGL